MTVSISDLESRLSKVRLKLLEKRKEVRETVHEHYKDLIGVADHAVSISEKTEVLVDAFSRMSTLSRALRVKAATAHLSKQTSTGSDSSPSGRETASFALVESIISVNGRILDSVNRGDFSETRRILETEIPSILTSSPLPDEFRELCENEIESLSQTKARVVSYCWRALGCASLGTSARLSSCLGLLRTLSPSDQDSTTKYWERRSHFLQTIHSLPDLLRHFDLTVSAGVPLSSEFRAKFGSAEGWIGKAVNEELSPLKLHAIREAYFSLKKQILDFRTENDMNPPYREVDVLAIIESKVRQCISETIRRSIASIDMNLETFNVESLEGQMNDLLEEILRFEISHRAEVLGSIAAELNGVLCTAALEADRTRKVGMNVSEILRRFSGSVLHELEPHIQEAIGKLRELQKDSFEMHFDQFVNEIALSDRAKGFIDKSSLGKAGDVALPCHPSAFVMNQVMQTTLEIVSVPEATISAKSALSRYFCSYFSSIDPSLHSLFDAAFVLILTSSVSDDPDYDYLSSTVYPKLQAAVLADQVDLLLYKDLIRSSAFLAVVRNKIIFRPLLKANPMFAHYMSLGIDPSTVVPESLSQSLAHESAIDKFAVLPVARGLPSGPTRAPAPVKKQAAPNMFSTSSVTSFLNQVGKITLGSATPPSR